MVERQHRATVTTLFWPEDLEPGEIVLDGDPFEHARARRLARDDRVRVINGRGRVAAGAIASVAKRKLIVTIQHTLDTPRPMDLAVLVPVADKERMLMAAEKCVELQVTSWQPVIYTRSRSVATRGEGEKFREKVRARMQAALEQSAGSWMPDVHEDAVPHAAFERVPPEWSRFVLDAGGQPLAPRVRNAPTALAVGPEGGFELAELASARERGWSRTSLAVTTLRFETAIVAGAAVVRAMQHPAGSQ